MLPRFAGYVDSYLIKTGLGIYRVTFFALSKHESIALEPQ